MEVFLIKEITNLEVLSTRTGFNTAVRHIKKTIGIVDTLGNVKNLGDILFELDDPELTGERAGLLLRMLLVDKLGYKTVSVNPEAVVENPPSLAEEFAKWKAVDLIVAYHHPDMGLLIANPKVREELAELGVIRKRELLVIYAGKGGVPADEICTKAALTAVSLFRGARVKIPAELYKGNFTVKKIAAKKDGGHMAPKDAAAKSRAKPRTAVQKPSVIREPERAAPPAVTSIPAAQVSKGPVRMTPLYSVVVQNELFHNGNVEAWKRIIASYNAAYPALQVYIYYEGERIMDINSLFKWGKVKHGSAIQFAVAGPEIRDVAKLQRYLIQGASHQFEAFLRGSVSSVLKLF
jgi:hypothetical protein